MRRAAFAVAASLVWLAFACNAIVGVTDVRLKNDALLDGDILDGDPSDLDTSTPLGESVFQVASGAEHTCAKKTDGTVKCWGHDDKMQTGVTGADAGVLLAPTAVPGVSDALFIAAGDYHTCIIHTSGHVSCWGEDSVGQLGDGKTSTRSRTPVDVVGIGDAKMVAGGATFSCAVRSSGKASCWGQNLSGQFGNGNKVSTATPVDVSDLTNAIAISAGEAHACAVTTAGKVACWGNGFNGQLGNGSSNESLVPSVVPTLDDMIAVSAAARTTCALRRDGAVYCWGANNFGQLGSGAANATPNPSPVIVSGVDAVAISSGTDHLCAVLRTGGVVCWGAGARGQIGDGKVRAASTATPVPVFVSGITNALSVGAGGDHSCAPTKSDSIRCWGANSFGQLGDRTYEDRATPVSVVGYP